MEDSGRPEEDTGVRDELRTISFRLREIQRLLAARVQQENRRLEDEGLRPVEGRTFKEQPEDEDRG